VFTLISEVRSRTTLTILIQLWHPVCFAVPFGRNVFQWWHALKKKHVKNRNGTGIPTGLQCWIAKKVMTTVFGNNETGTASKKKTKTWERPARKKKEVWSKPWE
jgi:hypothetical protein